MGYWKSKVLPKIKKVFDINGKKAAAAAEACKSFDDSKEEINKEFEEKKTELHTKVVEIYESSSTEIKSLVKERKDAGVKKNSTAVHIFLEELVKIEFPGSKQVCEASTKFGPGLVSGPVLFVFEKVSTFVVTEDKEESVAVIEEETTTSGGAGGNNEKEIVVEEEETKSTPPPPPAPEPQVLVAAEKIEPTVLVATEPAPLHCEAEAKTEEADQQAVAVHPKP